MTKNGDRDFWVFRESEIWENSELEKTRNLKGSKRSQEKEKEEFYRRKTKTKGRDPPPLFTSFPERKFGTSNSNLFLVIWRSKIFRENLIMSWCQQILSKRQEFLKRRQSI